MNTPVFILRALELSDAQGMAALGQKQAKTYAHYRDAAGRTALADTALANLAEYNLANREQNG
jgi:hypothetical protein